ncbi:MAG: hypothetical protein J4G05_09060, partial [Chlorobi bacterium]|nr:hypothetical protein [Chlorobiota bacterium]
ARGNVWGGRDPGKYIVVKLFHLLHFRVECGFLDQRSLSDSHGINPLQNAGRIRINLYRCHPYDKLGTTTL